MGCAYSEEYLENKALEEIKELYLYSRKIYWVTERQSKYLLDVQPGEHAEYKDLNLEHPAVKGIIHLYKKEHDQERSDVMHKIRETVERERPYRKTVNLRRLFRRLQRMTPNRSGLLDSVAREMGLVRLSGGDGYTYGIPDLATPDQDLPELGPAPAYES